MPNMIAIAKAAAEKKRIKNVDWEKSQATIDNHNQILRITLAKTDNNPRDDMEIDLKSKNNEVKEILELSAKIISDELRDDFEKLRQKKMLDDL